LALADRTLKGEIVLVVDRAAPVVTSDDTLQAALIAALETTTLKEAVAQVVTQTGLPRRQVYQAALALEQDRT
jgi:16S rRNA (cytidine1402-2'-O)-methyltransferase